MQFVDLQNAVNAACETRKLGTLVSARLKLQLADGRADPVDYLAGLMSWLKSLFADAQRDAFIREHPAARQITALATLERGATLFITVGCGASTENRLGLLLIGNHGILRLEGDDPIEELPVGGADDRERWRQMLEYCRSGRSSAGETHS